MGVFKDSLDTVFKLQYGLDIEHELTGKPGTVAFEYASKKIPLGLLNNRNIAEEEYGL